MRWAPEPGIQIAGCAERHTTVPFHRAVTHHYAIADADEAMRTALGAGDAMKVVISPGPSEAWASRAQRADVPPATTARHRANYHAANHPSHNAHQRAHHSSRRSSIDIDPAAERVRTPIVGRTVLVTFIVEGRIAEGTIRSRWNLSLASGRWGRSAGQ